MRWKSSGVFVSLLVVGLWGSGCNEKVPEPAARQADKPAGATCRVSSECKQGLACADRVCVRMPRQANESCSEQASCADGLVCQRSAITERKTWEADDYEPSDTYGDRCLTPKGVAALERQQERELLEKSGLSEEEITAKTVVAERPGGAVGPGLSIRVVRTESKISDERQTVFAACRDTERLVSGSCGHNRGDNVIVAHINDPEVGVAGYSESDTVGARWNCVGARGDTVIAKALCQRLPAEK